MTSGISDQTSPDSTKLGGWLFRHRTAVPIPFALALLLVRVGRGTVPWTLVLGGVVLTLAGEALRLAAVRRIGVISRTRSGRLGPLVMTGPFAYVRNPLYVGNVLIWSGVAVTAGLPLLAASFAILLLLEYQAIVKWEEKLLESKYGDSYDAYRASVPRWIPRFGAWRHVAPIPCQSVPGTDADGFSWRETLFSERGTLVAIVVGYFSLWLTARF
jgi:protein-S-isoprenylcysteine O-methyltransferase Ste14